MREIQYSQMENWLNFLYKKSRDNFNAAPYFEYLDGPNVSAP